MSYRSLAGLGFSISTWGLDSSRRGCVSCPPLFPLPLFVAFGFVGHRLTRKTKRFGRKFDHPDRRLRPCILPFVLPRFNGLYFGQVSFKSAQCSSRYTQLFFCSWRRYLTAVGQSTSSNLRPFAVSYRAARLSCSGVHVLLSMWQF